MNLNHFIISGNLTRDPEMRTVGTDRAVTAFTIAHNTRFKTADGEQREEVSFIDCEVWGRQGEIAAQYLTKGSATIVEGRLKQDNWTDKEGQKRSKLKLVVDRVHLVPRGVREDGSSDTSEPPMADYSPATHSPAPMAQPSARSNAPGGRPAGRAAATTSHDQPPF